MTQSSQVRTLYELVLDYAGSLDIQRRRRLAEFLGVQDQTIRSWQRGKSVPAGARALRLHYLLEQVGVNDVQWQPTDGVVLDAGRLLAFHVLTEQQLLAELSDPSLDDQDIIRMLTGFRHVKPAFMDAFRRIVDSHTHLLDSAIKSWSDLLVKDARDQLITELSNRLVAMLPLCEQMITDEWTAAERHELRKKCGNDTVFKLYNTLGALCGEKARQHTLRSVASMVVR